jgi:hypothetical protein
MACVNLANEYGKLGYTIPSKDSPIKERSDWLLTQQWCCRQMVQPYEIKCNTPDNDICSKQENFTPAVKDSDGKIIQNSTIDLKGGIPTTILKESGFLAWVNDRGMKCINLITGSINIWPVIDPEGEYKEPGSDTGFQESFCNGACYNVKPDQETCFECIKDVLEDPDPSPSKKLLQTVCPALYDPANNINEVDTELMKTSVECHACIASKSTGLITSKPKMSMFGKEEYTSVYNSSGFENIWGCITGHFPVRFSVGAIIGIVFLIIILIIGIALQLRSLFQHRRNTTENKDIDILRKYTGATTKTYSRPLQKLQ